ncbi:MAG: carboxymuconolactone decarboxylase family protein [Burkholderiaceae bacterium]
MSLLPKIEYDQAPAAVRAVYDDIRHSRNADYINDVWKVLANDPATLDRCWQQVKEVMRAGELDPVTKELIYLAVSITNDCEYCINTHHASARGKGMTDGQLREMLAIVGLANQMNKLVAGYQVELDEKYRDGR